MKNILWFLAIRTARFRSVEPLASAADTTGKFSDNLVCFLYRCNSEFTKITHCGRPKQRSVISTYNSQQVKTYTKNLLTKSC